MGRAGDHRLPSRLSGTGGLRPMPGDVPVDRVRLASFNVETLGGAALAGAGGDEAAALDERIALLRPQLIRLDADILCLQEVDGQRGGKGGAGRGRKRCLAALDRLLASTTYAGFHRLTPLRDTHPGLSPAGPAAPRTPAARYPPRADWRRSAA